MVQDDSHSTFRVNAESISRRAASIAMAFLRTLAGWRSNLNPVGTSNYLKLSRHTYQYWDIFLIPRHFYGLHPNERSRRHRPQNPRTAAIRRPHHHGRTRRQSRAVGVALSSPRQAARRARRDHALYRERRPEIAGAARLGLHLDQARAAEGGGPQPLRARDLEMGRGAGVLSDDR